MGCGASHPTYPIHGGNSEVVPSSVLSSSMDSDAASSFTQPSPLLTSTAPLHPASSTRSAPPVKEREETKERGSSIDTRSAKVTNRSPSPTTLQPSITSRNPTAHSSAAPLIPLNTSPSSHPRTSVARSPSPTVSRASSTPKTGLTLPSSTPASRYQLTSSILGKGHFARVSLAVDLVSGVQVAIKIIDKKEMTKNRSIVESEMSILKRMGRHRHIVSLLDFYEDEKKFFIVMELCSGGDLFSRIVEQGKYSELQAVRSCRQIAEALAYIHSCGITHRDLKPENILLLDSSVDSDLKIADFGLSKILPNIDDVMRTVCGTWAYCAPEVISHKTYTNKVDNWTLGVLMYILLCGYHPFDCYGDLPEPELLDKIMRVDFEFEDAVWDEVSKDAKSLISRLLVYEPDERLSLDDFLNSEWIKSGGRGGSGADLKIVQARLSKFSHKTFRALVTAKVAIKKFRQSISRSPRTPASGSRIMTGQTVQGLGMELKEGEDEGGEVGDGEGGRAGDGSLTGLAFLNRLDKKEIRSSASGVSGGQSVSGGERVAVGEKEKGGLGRGMRISEEQVRQELSQSEEDEEDARPN